MNQKIKSKEKKAEELDSIKEVESQDLNINRFAHEQENTLLVWAKKFGLLVFEVVKVVLISLAIILPVRMFLIQPFYVEGASMEPNFYNKEYLIIDEISYRFNEPQRGDVVVFRNPDRTNQYYIKRVIGLPGESVEIVSGIVSIDGNELAEDEYIENLSIKNLSSVNLEADEYVVLGDNRMVSRDSRSFGPLDKKYIIGKVWFRGWPIDRASTFNRPTY